MEQKVVTLDSLLKVLHMDRKLSSADEVLEAERLIGDVLRMSGAEIDTLVALYERGPLYDGVVPSKSGRDALLRSDMAAKVIVGGDDGYNACTYKGGRAYRVFRAGARKMPLTDADVYQCGKCGGTGKDDGLHCHTCHGKGRIPSLGLKYETTDMCSESKNPRQV